MYRTKNDLENRLAIKVFYNNCGSCEKILSKARKLLKKAKRGFGSGHVLIFLCQAKLSAALYNIGKNEESEKYLDNALEFYKKHEQSENLFLIALSAALSEAFFSRKNYELSLHFADKCLNWIKKHRRASLNKCQKLISVTSGKIRAAVFKKSANKKNSVIKEKDGISIFLVLKYLKEISTIYEDREQYRKAALCHREALIINRHFHPSPQNSETIYSLYKMGSALILCPETKKRGLLVHKHFLHIDMDEKNAYYCVFALKLGAIAESFLEHQMYAEAECLYERVIKIQAKKQFKPFPDMYSTYDSLAKACYEQKKYEKSRKIFEKLLAYAQKKSNPDQKTVLSHMHSLSFIYYETGRFEATESMCHDFLEFLEKNPLTGYHAYEANIIELLLAVTRHKYQPLKREKLLMQRLEILQNNSFGPDEEIIEAMAELALFCQNNEQLAKALQIRYDIYELHKKMFNGISLEAIDNLRELACILNYLYYESEAEKLHLEALEYLEKTHPENELILTIIFDIIRFYDNIDNVVGVEEYGHKAFEFIEKKSWQAKPCMKELQELLSVINTELSTRINQANPVSIEPLCSEFTRQNPSETNIN